MTKFIINIMFVCMILTVITGSSLFIINVLDTTPTVTLTSVVYPENFSPIKVELVELQQSEPEQNQQEDSVIINSVYVPQKSNTIFYLNNEDKKSCKTTGSSSRRKKLNEQENTGTADSSSAPLQNNPISEPLDIISDTITAQELAGAAAGSPAPSQNDPISEPLDIISDTITAQELAGAGAYLQVISQTPDMNVAKDEFFNFSISVKCFNDTCNNVILTLDPSESKNKKEYPDFTEEDKKEAEKRLKKIKDKIKEKNLKWEAASSPAFIDYVRKDRQGKIKYIEPMGAERELAGSAITQEDEKILPYYFDWRNAYGENWVTSAKHQGACASCWAFAAVGVAESALNIYNRWPTLDLDLSEQDVTSCSGAGSCAGGGSDNIALSYIRDTGVVNETCFPYVASQVACSGKCSDGKQYHIQDKLTIVEGIDGVDKEAAIKALLKYGPSTAQIRAYTDLFSYVSGIYEPSVGTDNGAHIINVIGYNETGDYFIVKNSYGTGWGMNGFGYIKSWVILNDSPIFNRLRFATGADQLNNKGVIPMNSGTPFYTITQNPYNCGNMNEGETCNVTWQVNATGFHLSSWDFFVIINSDAYNSTSPISTITIIGDYIPDIESIECETKGAWKNCSDVRVNETLTKIRVNVSDENLNIVDVDVRLKENETVLKEGSAYFDNGFYVYDSGQKINSNISHKIEVDVYDETYFINGFIAFEPLEPVPCVENWTEQYGSCEMNDTQLKYYIDSNACGTTNDLPADNGTYVACNYCTEDIQGPFTTACNANDEQIQYYLDNNYAACCAITVLPSDCNIDTPAYDNQTLVCDYCTPDWQPYNTTCDGTQLTQYYLDDNDCYSITGLADDLLGKPVNQTFPCGTGECNVSSDCGTDGLLGNDYCSGDEVWDTYRTYTCNNPGTPSSTCSYSDNDKLKETCIDNCNNGICVFDKDNDGFYDDADCNDTDANVNPNATEACNRVDDNCNNETDENVCADLNIESYEYYWPQNPVANNWVMFKIVLRNIGYEPTDNIYWTMNTDSADRNPEHGPFSLAVDEFVNIYPQYKYSLAGSYNPKFIVDYLDLVVERNESNNEVVIPVTIS